jgi:hypothetical protein
MIVTVPSLPQAISSLKEIRHIKYNPVIELGLLAFILSGEKSYFLGCLLNFLDLKKSFRNHVSSIRGDWEVHGRSKIKSGKIIKNTEDWLKRIH